MPLNKTPVNINFSSGVDTKTDPFQVPGSKFLTLVNSEFTLTGALSKRNGFGLLGQMNATNITTYESGLVGLSDDGILAFSQTTNTSYAPTPSILPTQNFHGFLQLSVQSLVKGSTYQSLSDSAISPNGARVVVYQDSSTTNAVYAILDSTTGQTIIGPTPITGSVVANGARAFILGNYFVIVYSAASGLRALAIDYSTYISGSDILVSSAYTPSTNPAFDGVVLSDKLYLGWANTTNLTMTWLDASLALGTTFTYAAAISPSLVALGLEYGSTSRLWVTFSNLNDGYTLWVNSALITSGTALHTIIATAHTQIVNAACSLSVSVGTCDVIYQVTNNSGYDASIRSDYLKKISVDSSGGIGSSNVLMRSVGIASKACVVDSVGTTYLLVIYASQFQPSYFLIGTQVGLTGFTGVVGRLAYSNGGGYYSGFLPSLSLAGSTLNTSYLIKDLLVPVNKTQGSGVVSGFYTQTGINAVAFELNQAANESFVDTGANLHISGAMVQNYDGALLTEEGFHLWPDTQINADNTYHGVTPSNSGGGLKGQDYYYVAVYEWTDGKGNIHRSAPSQPIKATVAAGSLNFTGNPFAGFNTIGSPSTPPPASWSSLYPGQIITDTTTPGNIAAGTYILSISLSGFGLLTINQAATGTGVANTLNTVETGSVVIKIPTLRLTGKPNIRIVLYRWSTAQQTYYQITSVNSPILNDTTVDYVSYTDTANDRTIVGNEILYTTGGVAENIAPPALSNIALYRTRAIGIDAEDPNLFWYSKQGIPNTPVEWSDLFTQYVPPSVAGVEVGPMRTVGALDDKMVIFKGNSSFYITGNGPDNTGANNDFSDAILISSAVGCVNQASIVNMPLGLMFQASGDQGIWIIGRDLAVKYIGAPVEAYNSLNVTSAVSVPGTRQVRFTLSNQTVLSYDYYFNEWVSFTTQGALKSTIFNGLHTYIGDQEESGANIYQETPGVFVDGSNTPVEMSFTTGWFNLAGLQGYERAYFFYLLGLYKSAHQISLTINYGYGTTHIPPQSVLITPTSSIPEQWRVFFDRGKIQSFQIEFQEILEEPGEGLILSGLNVVIGIKKGYRAIPASSSTG